MKIGSRRFLMILMVVCLVGILIGGFSGNAQGEFQPMTIRMLARLPISNKTVEDVLTPIWREKTKVTVEVVGVTEGMDPAQWLQMQLVAGTLPDILAGHVVVREPKVINALVKQNLLYEWTAEKIREYMPRFAKRVADLGGSLEAIIEDNKDENGKVYRLPDYGSALCYPVLRKDDFMMKDLGTMLPYMCYFRDDILKKIFPKVRTEAELKALYVKNGGNLTLEEAIGDIPIKNRTDLTNYLRKVKKLNLKVGTKTVIPGQLTCSADATSTAWALLTAFGTYWQTQYAACYKEDKVVFPMACPEWKTYMKWWNQLYNEVLLDQEAWIMKDDQRNGKVINGEYAVFQNWLPVNDARQVGQERGYGYRLFPIFMVPLDNKYMDGSLIPYSYRGEGTMLITKSIKEKDLAQVMNWVDWNMSPEADELRWWGPPPGKFYTGDGRNRRFKPEYKELEDWFLRNVEGAGKKDGPYYGFYNNGHTANLGALPYWNSETFWVTGIGYTMTPGNVYPKQPSLKDNIDTPVMDAIKKHFRAQTRFYREVPGVSVGSLTDIPAWKDACQRAYSQEAGGLLANVLVAKPSEFEKMFKRFHDTIYDAKWDKAFAEMVAKWEEMYHKYLKAAMKKAVPISK